jgi:hypothetical protein
MLLLMPLITPSLLLLHHLHLLEFCLTAMCPHAAIRILLNIFSLITFFFLFLVVVMLLLLILTFLT